MVEWRNHEERSGMHDEKYTYIQLHLNEINLNLGHNIIIGTNPI